MAIILCIETATEVCSVALAQNGETVYSQQLESGNMHASHLHWLIQEVLHITKATFTDVNAIAISMGPGSYTGLRVGVSAAKGFCYALNIPLIAVDTLKSLAFGFANSNPTKPNSYIVPMLDARRMEVYTAVYTNNLSLVEPTNAKIIDEESYKNLNTENWFYFFGNGALKCKDSLKHLHATYVNYNCNASNMSFLAQQAFDDKNFADIAYFEPYYLKDFITTTPKKL